MNLSSTTHGESRVKIGHEASNKIIELHQSVMVKDSDAAIDIFDHIPVERDEK
jgi:hypothetical protein